MTTYVALLRAVNVGTANRIKMDALRAAFVGAGHTDAVTHIQSGNVIFSSKASAAGVKAGIEKLIRADLGKTVTAIVRTAAEMAEVTAAHPLMTKASDPKSLYVSFLDHAPKKAAVEALTAMQFAGERLQVVGRHVYLDYGSAHAGTSKLNNAIIERKLGVAATSRNWAVAGKLAELAAGHRPGGQSAVTPSR